MKRYIPCSWIRKLDSVKMSIIIKLMCTFNTSPGKTSETMCADLGVLTLEPIWKCKGSKWPQTLLRKSQPNCNGAARTRRVLSTGRTRSRRINWWGRLQPSNKGHTCRVHWLPTEVAGGRNRQDDLLNKWTWATGRPTRKKSKSQPPTLQLSQN